MNARAAFIALIFSSRTASELKVHGRLHRHEREHLKDVVLNHVAHNARRFVVAAASFDADRLGVGQLHVIYVLAIPQRLEDAVGEAKDEQVLDSLFAEIMVDAINLLLVQIL